MNKYGIWAVRGGSSIFGPAEAWYKDTDGEYLVLNSEDEAQEIADQYNSSKSSLTSVHYTVRVMEPQMAADIQCRRESMQKQGLELSGP